MSRPAVTNALSGGQRSSARSRSALETTQKDRHQQVPVLLAICPICLTSYAFQRRQLIHQGTKGSWHRCVIGANSVTENADVDGDRVLIFIRVKLDDQVFRQVEEFRLLDQLDEITRVPVWKLTKIQLEPHTLTDKSACALESNCGHMCLPFHSL